MLIQHKLGNLKEYDSTGKTIDWLPLEWYEAGKRIIRKQTLAGKEISLKFLNENPAHTDGDILWIEGSLVIAICIVACHCIVVKPKNMFEMAAICYEIGNKHLPLYYEENLLLIPFEKPLFQLLLSQGYPAREETKKLICPLKTTVIAHDPSSSDSLFSKIMKLKTTAS